MSGCCQPHGYERVFSARQAERDAARFTRTGLTWAPRRTVELYRRGTISGRTLLEVGGGVGDMQIELLAAGVERATSIELSAGYEPAARRLLAERGMAERSAHVVGDLATAPELVEAADLVVGHSVVCCYPDAVGLVAAAASRATRHLVLSYPRDTWWMRAWAPVQNLYPRLRGSSFRFRVHPPGLVLATIDRAGLVVSHTERSRIDHLVVATRSARTPRPEK